MQSPHNHIECTTLFGLIYKPMINIWQMFSKKINNKCRLDRRKEYIGRSSVSNIITMANNNKYKSSLDKRITSTSMLRKWVNINTNIVKSWFDKRIVYETRFSVVIELLKKNINTMSNLDAIVHVMKYIKINKSIHTCRIDKRITYMATLTDNTRSSRPTIVVSLVVSIILTNMVLGVHTRTRFVLFPSTKTRYNHYYNYNWNKKAKRCVHNK